MCITLSLLCSLQKTLFMDWQDVIALGTHKTRQSFSSAFLYLCAYICACVRVSRMFCSQICRPKHSPPVERPGQDLCLPAYTHQELLIPTTHTLYCDNYDSSLRHRHLFWTQSDILTSQHACQEEKTHYHLCLTSRPEIAFRLN